MTKTYKILAAAIVTVGALSASAVFAGSSAPAAAPIVATQSVQTAVTSGRFEGRSDHVTSGIAEIVKTASGYDLVLGADFYLDGAPDPVIGFGNNGEYVAASQFTQLENKRGQQRYTLPANFTPGQFSEVYVWCEKFAVPLGVATLN